MKFLRRHAVLMFFVIASSFKHAFRTTSSCSAEAHFNTNSGFAASHKQINETDRRSVETAFNSSGQVEHLQSQKRHLVKIESKSDTGNAPMVDHAYISFQLAESGARGVAAIPGGNFQRSLLVFLTPVLFLAVAVFVAACVVLLEKHARQLWHVERPIGISVRLAAHPRMLQVLEPSSTNNIVLFLDALSIARSTPTCMRLRSCAQAATLYRIREPVRIPAVHPFLKALYVHESWGAWCRLGEGDQLDRATACGRACLDGRISVLKSLLSEGIDLNSLSQQEDASGEMWEDTPLGWAVGGDQIEVLRFLLDHGADANKVASHGGAPLHLAAQKAKLAVVQHLVAFGARITLKDARFGRDAIAWTEGDAYSVHGGPEEARSAVKKWLKAQSTVQQFRIHSLQASDDDFETGGTDALPSSSKEEFRCRSPNYVVAPAHARDEDSERKAEPLSFSKIEFW